MSKIKIRKISITDLDADCIVNAANDRLAAGGASAELSSEPLDILN